MTFFAPGFDYELLGFIPTNRHLLGVEGANPEETLFVLGTDLEGRDMWSRLMYATRTSLTIGLVAVAISLVLGVLLGGISGYYGGVVDTVQRVIEILRSVPTIPLWMGLAAAMPKTWSVQQVYFTITIIISLIGWTELARVVRGRFLSLREEDFVTAADLVGARQSRIIFVHMVPLFLSHIIAATTLALPAMIISETALSFLGLGLRPPAISWGYCCNRRRTCRRWRSRHGSCCRRCRSSWSSWPSISSATGCATPPIRITRNGVSGWTKVTG